MSWNVNNSFRGGYSGNSFGGLTGGSSFSPSYTTSNSGFTYTPSVSHSVNQGSNHTFGGGIGVTRHFDSSTSATLSASKHGNESQIGISFVKKF